MAVDHKRLTARGAAFLLLGVASYYAIWGGEYSALDLLRIAQLQRVQEIRLQESRLQVDSLRTLAGQLESDPATIEAVARERFGMIRQGEFLYRFVEVGTEFSDDSIP